MQCVSKLISSAERRLPCLHKLLSPRTSSLEMHVSLILAGQPSICMRLRYDEICELPAESPVLLCSNENDRGELCQGADDVQADVAMWASSKVMHFYSLLKRIRFIRSVCRANLHTNKANTHYILESESTVRIRQRRSQPFNHANFSSITKHRTNIAVVTKVAHQFVITCTFESLKVQRSANCNNWISVLIATFLFAIPFVRMIIPRVSIPLLWPLIIRR